MPPVKTCFTSRACGCVPSILPLYCLFITTLVLFLSPTFAWSAKGTPLEKYTGHPSDDIEVQGSKAHIYDLHIIRTPNDMGETGPKYNYTVYYHNKQIAAGNFIEIMPRFPKPELVTVQISSFSGGAYCCWGYTLLTINTTDRSVVQAELDAESPSMEYDEGFFEPDGRIRLGSWDFFNYSTEKGKLSINLYPAASPKMTRYLVYDNGHWRGDRPGEFAKDYTRLLDALLREKPSTEPGYAALKVAYYSLMAGQGQKETTAAVAKTLGQKLAPLGGTIVADVWKDITEHPLLQNAATPPQGQSHTHDAAHSAPTAAPAPERTDADAAQCRQGNKTPCDYAACLDGRLKFWDDALNSRFRELMHAYPEDRRAALKKEEIVWVKKYLKLQDSLKDKKTGDCQAQATYLETITSFVRERVLVLRSMPAA